MKRLRKKMRLTNLPFFSFCFALVFFILLAPVNVLAQEEARFGYSVAQTTVNLEVLEPLNEIENSYRWSFGQPCGENESSCYEETGANVTVNDMWEYVGEGTNLTSIYLDVFNSNDTLIAEESATTSLGAGVNYADSDGDGIKNFEEQDGCKNDPAPDCGENNNENDDDTIDVGSGIPPSEGLVKCGRQTEVVNTGSGTTTKLVNPCDYDDLINLVSRMIQWLIGILILVATLLFVYAGFLYLLADGNSNQAGKAKDIFTNVAFGFFTVLVSVLFVVTLVTMFTRSDWEENWMNVVPIPELGIEKEDLPNSNNMYT